jgi:Response regulator containing CheY-like receiver, AAA-type ATPase, and DNA-binding domains
MTVRPVLIVEDDDDIRSMLARLLIRHGYAVDMATDGLEAIARLQTPARYKAVILDFALPGVDGGVVLQHIIAKAPRLLERTIVVTAHGDRVRTLRIPELCETMDKPVKFPHLLAALGRLCNVPDDDTAVEPDELWSEPLP